MNSTTDISNKPLLESMLVVYFPTGSIDLHNDFDCLSISIQKDIIKFIFLNKSKETAQIILSDFLIIKQEFNFNFTGPITLDNFYKGRIEIKNELEEFDKIGRQCFYFHFYEDIYLEVLAKTAVVSFDGFI